MTYVLSKKNISKKKNRIRLLEASILLWKKRRSVALKKTREKVWWSYETKIKRRERMITKLRSQIRMIERLFGSQMKKTF